MYKAKRPLKRPALIIFILATFVLAACSRSLNTGNWPGLSTDGQKVYVAYGPSVIAYDVESQQQAWQFPQESAALPIYYAAPSVVDGKVIIGDYGASSGFFSPGKITTLTALEDRDSGIPSQLWTQNELLEGSVVAPPLHVGEQLFVGTSDNLIMAMDANNGSELWRFETGNAIWGQPAYKDGVVYIAVLDKKVHALDADTGESVWADSALLDGAVGSQPVLNTEFVYISGFDGKLYALSITSGEVAWTFEAEAWLWNSPVLLDAILYFADATGNVYAVDAVSGAQVWRQQVGTAVQASPVIVNDIIYVAAEGNKETEQGSLTALAIESGAQEWQQIVTGPIYSTPVIADDTLVVALSAEDAPLLIGYDLETGAQQWSFTPSEE